MYTHLYFFKIQIKELIEVSFYSKIQNGFTIKFTRKIYSLSALVPNSITAAPA